jgi:hypothetical protein
MTVAYCSEFKRLMARLAHARSRWRAIEATRRSVLLAAFTVVVILTALLIDRLFHVSAPALLAIDGVVAAMFIAYLFWGFLKPLLAPLTDDRMALHIENRLGNLDSRLINAVQVGKDERLAGNPFAPVLVRQNCQAIEGVDFRPALPFAALRPAALTCFGVVALMSLYAYRAPDHFVHSLRRFLSPQAAPPPLTDTRIEVVEPGDTVVLGGSDVSVRVRLAGEALSRLALRMGTRGNWRESGDSTLLDDGRFEWVIPHVTRPTDYQVIAGDARSAVYHVQLTVAPSVQSMDVTLTYPDYTRRPAQTWQGYHGNIEALVGSTAKLTAYANKRLRSAELHRSRHQPVELQVLKGEERDSILAEMRVEENETYWFKIVDETGHPNVAAIRYAIVAIRDQSPNVQLLSQETEMKLTPTETADIRFAASDDYGLVEATLRLELTRAFDQSTHDLPPRPRKLEDCPLQSTDTVPLQLAELKVSEGDLLRYRVEVQDALGQRASSATRSITVVRRQADQTIAKASRMTCLERLQELLARQKENLSATRDLVELASASSGLEDLDRVTAGQMAIRRDSEHLAMELPSDQARVRASLRRLVDEEMAEAVEALTEVGKASRASSKRRVLTEAVLIEEEIVRKLAELALMGKTVAEAAEKAEQAPEVAKPPDTEENQKALDAFKDKLTDFYKEQKANVLETQKLLELPPDSEEAEALARKVLERQRLCKKLCREAKDQTKTLAEKEITNEHLIEKMEDVFRAVSDAESAAEQKDVRRTLMKEEMALLMANSIPDNGEAFLGGNGSKTKWDFEDWPEEERPETQLPPIPPDMHDVLGELVDRQEELADDNDDMQSQMHFGATDNTGLIGGDGGPLSNWMAKGRSGNTTPKANEVGGRAGSGRTGKSSGEFVDKVDTAKEGRETEDRYTKEQSMEGFVKSEGDKKRAGGSTSTGGKRSEEATEFGLRGDASTHWSRQRMKISEQQDDLRIKAELFASRLKEITGRPDFDVNAALLLMQEVEVDLSGGRFEHAVRKQVEAAHHLRRLNRRLAAYSGHTEAPGENARNSNGKGPQRDDPLQEKFPGEYRKMLQAYYKALSEAAGE